MVLDPRTPVIIGVGEVLQPKEGVDPSDSPIRSNSWSTRRVVRAPILEEHASSKRVRWSPLRRVVPVQQLG